MFNTQLRKKIDAFVEGRPEQEIQEAIGNYMNVKYVKI